MIEEAVRCVPFLLLFGLLPCGCASRQTRYYGGGVYRRDGPRVTLESCVETQDSPGRGYPYSPYPMPVYPWQFVRAGLAGEVDVKLTVGKDGLVQDVVIVRSSHKEFEAPVIAAVRHWRFVEVKRLGVKGTLGMIVICRVKFSFDDR